MAHTIRAFRISANSFGVRRPVGALLGRGLTRPDPVARQATAGESGDRSPHFKEVSLCLTLYPFPLFPVPLFPVVQFVDA